MMKSSHFRWCLLAGVATTGCYKSIGVADIPRTHAPQPVPDQDIVASDEVVRLDSYHVTTSGNIVQNHRREGEARYGGSALSFGELSALADPNGWQQTLDHANELRATCRRGVIPEYVATVATIAMSAIGIAVASSHGDSSTDLSTNEQLGLTASYASAGVAVGAYAIGYFLGGHACNELEQYRADNHIDATDTTFYGDEIDLVNKLANEFNAKRQAAAGN
ncbi:MAG TPA: hypothetical protein VGO00_29565 [Kofleriaceae bacterium]|nr:hypothetical protein [Kofleriaceae bacterium]